MRTHAEWNVDTHIFWATGPTSAATRVFISSAALLVNVMARISNGLTPWSRMRWAMRWVRTRVLPEPAPATTSSGPSAWTTASDCTGLSPSSRSLMGSWMAPSGRTPGDGASGASGAPSGPASASAVSNRGTSWPGIARPIVGPGCDTGAECGHLDFCQTSPVTSTVRSDRTIGVRPRGR